MAERNARTVRGLLAGLALGVALWAFGPAALAGPAAIPVHGNWCGPGHGAADGLVLPAIDPLDDACRRHDACYAHRSYLDCGCDLAFMAELKTIGWRAAPFLADKARAVHDALGLAPCTGVAGSAEKQQSVWRDAVGDTLTGRAAPWAMATRLLRLGAEAAHRQITR